jgi:nucleoside-diphosphate-sugar epimerase
MKVAITGGTGFVGGHLARALAAEGHAVVVIARGAGHRPPELPTRAVFCRSDLSDTQELTEYFSACDAVAHCAGINREIGNQTYDRVHLRGTANVVASAARAGVKKILLLSFLRARPDCGSPYHESKWAAEQIVRSCGLDFTVIKAGVIYGKGDHLLDHITRSLCTVPLFATVGLRDRSVRPLAIGDLLKIMMAAIVEGRLSRMTVAVTGPEEFPLSQVPRRIARVLGRRVLLVRMPVWFHYVLAGIFERIMAVPLVSLAQVRILSEGIVEATASCHPLAADLIPTTFFTPEQIRQGMPFPERFGLDDVRCCA